MEKSTQFDLLQSDDGFESFDLPRAAVSLWNNYLEEPQANDLFQQLRQSIQWQQPELLIAGKSHKIPRLTAFYGAAGVSYRYSGLDNKALLWPETLRLLAEKVGADCGAFFNSVLLNYCRDGDDSMGYHSDDEASLGRCSTIASLSVGDERRFLLKPKKGFQQELGVSRSVAANLANGSLLLMAGQTQHYWQHALPKQSSSQSGRINLTFRAIRC